MDLLNPAIFLLSSILISILLTILLTYPINTTALPFGESSLVRAPRSPGLRPSPYDSYDTSDRGTTHENDRYDRNRGRNIVNTDELDDLYSHPTNNEDNLPNEYRSNNRPSRTEERRRYYSDVSVRNTYDSDYAVDLDDSYLLEYWMLNRYRNALYPQPSQPSRTNQPNWPHHARDVNHPAPTRRS